MNKHISSYALGALAFLSVFLVTNPQAFAASEVTGAMSASVGQASRTAANAITIPLRPTHIIIPTARVDADIIDLGVTASNNLDVPHNFVQTGWYKYGPVPGQPGNAVIDGHVDNAGSIPGPFKHLYQAKIGDYIYVALSNGTFATFRVVDSSIYLTSQFPSESVFRGDDQSVLKIITCNGTYRRSLGTYDHRLIVTAVRVK